MRRFAFSCLVALGAAGLLSGCANWSAVFEKYRVDREDGLTTVLVDAKQRAIISKRRDSDIFDSETMRPDPNGTQSHRGHEKSLPIVVCAEPSPDVFAALSESFSGSAGWSGTSKEAQLALSMALAESAGELRRARTIQLLRDGLFNACEGYANGALGPADYKGLLNKYANATLTLLAIEQLTPQATTAPVTLSSAGTEANSKVSISNQPSADKPPKGGNSDQSNPQGTNDPTGTTDTGGTSDMEKPTSTKPDTAQAKKKNAKTTQTKGNSAGDGAADKPKTKDQTSPDAAKDTTQGDAKKQGDATNGQGTSAKTSAPTSTRSNDPYALPAPTEPVVQAVQYLVSSFLIDTMVSECFDQLRTSPRVAKQDGVTEEVVSYCKQLLSYASSRIPDPYSGTQPVSPPSPKLPKGAKKEEGDAEPKVPAEKQQPPRAKEPKAYSIQ